MGKPKKNKLAKLASDFKVIDIPPKEGKVIIEYFASPDNLQCVRVVNGLIEASSTEDCLGKTFVEKGWKNLYGTDFQRFAYPRMETLLTFDLRKK